MIVHTGRGGRVPFGRTSRDPKGSSTVIGYQFCRHGIIVQASFTYQAPFFHLRPENALQNSSMSPVQRCHFATFPLRHSRFHLRYFSANNLDLTQSVHSCYSYSSILIVINRIYLLITSKQRQDSTSTNTLNHTLHAFSKGHDNVRRPLLSAANGNPEPPDIPTSQRPRPRHSLFCRLQLAKIRLTRSRLGG